MCDLETASGMVHEQYAHVGEMKIVSPDTSLILHTLPDANHSTKNSYGHFLLRLFDTLAFLARLLFQIHHKRHAFSPAKVIKNK